MEKKLAKSIRKYIREEKARIRREVFDVKKQMELINELYQKFFKTTNQKDEAQRNL